MRKHIFLFILFISVITYSISFKYLLADNPQSTSRIKETTSKNQGLKDISLTTPKNNISGNRLKILTQPFKAFGLHMYIGSEGKFRIDSIHKIFDDYKKAYDSIFHLIRVELKNVQIKDPALRVIVIGIMAWGLLFFVANQFLGRLVIKYPVLQRKTGEIVLHKFLAFVWQNYPAIISFSVIYFIIYFTNTSNALTKILFWGFGGWLFISCYNTLRNYILAPHRIKNIYVFHDTTIAYIRNVIRNISLSIIIYFITVNILSIVNISLTGRFFCSLIFFTSLFVITIIYFHYGFNKAIHHPYTKSNIGKLIPRSTQDSQLFLIVINLGYFSFSLFFCIEFNLILMGYAQLALKGIIWFGIVYSSFMFLLLITIYTLKNLSQKDDGKDITRKKINITQREALATFLNPFKIIYHFWQYRDLIKQFTWREVVGRYKGSYLGIGWSFLQPMLMLVIYTFVFSTVLNSRWGLGQTEGKGIFALTMFTGLITYGVFSEVLTAAPGLIIANPNYVKKIVFPLEILPVVRLLSALIHAGFSLIILLIGVLIITRSLNYTVVFLPIVWLPMALFSLGLGYFLASLGVFVRDIGHSMGLVVTILLFISAIFYPLSALPENIRVYSCYNPIAVFVENARRVVMFGQTPIWLWTGIMTAAGGVVLVLGFLWFMKTKKAFADVI